MDRDEPGRRLGMQRRLQRELEALRRSARLARVQHERPHLAPEAEGLQAPLQLGPREVAAREGDEHVAGEPPGGRVGDPQAQELERDRGHALLEQQPVGVGVRAGVLHADEPGLGRPRRHALPRRRDVEHDRPRSELRVRGRDRAGVAPEERQLLAGEPTAELVRRDDLAASVEHDDRPAQRRGQGPGDRREPSLAEDDALQALLRADRAAQELVLLVDDVAERPLGDGDERELVGHLEDREAPGVRLLHHRHGDGVVGEARPHPDAGEAVVVEPRDERPLAVGVGELHPGREEDLAARQPRGRIEQLARVHPPDRLVQPGLTAVERDVEVGDQLADRQHGATRARVGSTPPRAPGAGCRGSRRTARRS